MIYWSDPAVRDTKYQLIEKYHNASLKNVTNPTVRDLCYKQPRPRTPHSFDTEGRVILCSSFSKTLSAALRVGSLASGRYLELIEHMKYVGTASTTTITQLAVAEFIQQGYYDHHVRTIRQQYRGNHDLATQAIKQHFPEGTRISTPQGSYVLWIELPSEVDTLELNKRPNYSLNTKLLSNNRL